MITLSDLEEGQGGVILSLKNEDSAPKLIEMGFIPGSKVQLFKKAPLGCPLCFVFEDQYQVSLRISDAKSIEIEGVSLSTFQKEFEAGV